MLPFNPGRFGRTAFDPAGGGGGGYVGPGDVVSGASAWWGLRAYSNATTGGNLVDVFGTNTSTGFTFVSKSDGTIELVAGGAAAFLASNVANTVIVKLYDQTGNGHDFIGTGGGAPAFTVASLSGFPTVNFISNQVLVAPGFAVSQPYSTAGVAKITSSAGQQVLITDSTNMAEQFNTTPAFRVASNTTLLSATISTNTWYALQGVLNGASSVNTVDTTDVTGNAGSNGITSGHTYTMGNDDFSQSMTGGFVAEVGIWPSAFSGGNRTSMNSNMHTFWGF